MLNSSGVIAVVDNNLVWVFQPGAQCLCAFVALSFEYCCCRILYGAKSSHKNAKVIVLKVDYYSSLAEKLMTSLP